MVFWIPGWLAGMVSWGLKGFSACMFNGKCWESAGEVTPIASISSEPKLFAFVNLLNGRVCLTHDKMIARCRSNIHTRIQDTPIVRYETYFVACKS